MDQFTGLRTLTQRLIVSLLLLTASGCALLNPAEPPQPPEVVVVEAEPEPEPPPAPAPPPKPKPKPKPKPAPAPVEPVKEPLHVAVLLTDRKPAYENVAVALERQLEDVAVFDLTDKSLTPEEIFASVEANATDIVVAIGLRAAKIAKARSTVPVVFSQVFNATDHELVGDEIRGVAVIPPLAMQLRHWKQIDPDLASVGAIIGTGHDTLIAEAQEAASSNDVEFRFDVATSDRETLYLFSRLAPSVDGYWLFPDNRILSVPVLRQMLRDAAKHGVQVTVFNDSLLKLGAVFSASAIEANIAAVIVDVLNKIDEHGSDAVPAISPLTDMSVTTNEAVMRRLKLASVDRAASR
ncbi:MAG: hypothetical protein KJO31_03620 [Gammaproteobacteria bacterium]|nr:hypothetical protein [Gammaproteobacteria bacterium]